VAISTIHFWKADILSGSLIGENALPRQPGVKILANAPDDIKCYISAISKDIWQINYVSVWCRPCAIQSWYDPASSRSTS